jgi:hypothetical protein
MNRYLSLALSYKERELLLLRHSWLREKVGMRA